MKSYYHESEIQDLGTREPHLLRGDTAHLQGAPVLGETRPLFLGELQDEETGQILLLSFVLCQAHLSRFPQGWLFLSCL